jgi:hypothetical protein
MMSAITSITRNQEIGTSIMKIWRTNIMSNLSLYNITNKFTELMSKAEEGELTEEEYNTLGEELAIELQNKSAGIIGYIQNEEALIDAIDNQIKRLQDLKKSKQNKLDKFKEYTKDNMNKLEIPKIETELGILSVNKSPISVEITDEDRIPEKYKKIIQTIKIDKVAIKKDIEAGNDIDGAQLSSGNTYLKIK